MDAADVTALTGAFDISALFSTFILLAPFILGVAGILLGVGIIKWGVRTVRKRLSGGVA